MTLKELRKKNNLTQSALAKTLGVTGNTISAIEGGRLKLSPKLSGRIKEVFGEAIEPETKKTKTAGKKTGRKTAAGRKKTASSAKTAVEIAPGTENKTAKKTGRARKAKIVIQSPMGAEITPDAILEKIGKADAVYVRVDQNKAYWVKGDETGSVDLW